MMAQSEAFRVIRTGLEIAILGLNRSMVLVTSASAGEGKTSTCAGLAASLASAGRRVVAVDLDLRHPDLHNRLGGHNEIGASDVLMDRRTLADALQFITPAGTSSPQGLYLLAAGPTVESPTELLAATRTKRLLDAVAEQADVVLIDVPPVLPVADALVVGRAVGAAIIVVESRRTTYQQVERVRDALGRSGVLIVGAVLNKHRSQDVDDEYEYGYGYPRTSAVSYERSDV
jgi:capsular exopolysaccharide synthesis family protein